MMRSRYRSPSARHSADRRPRAPRATAHLRRSRVVRITLAACLALQGCGADSRSSTQPTSTPTSTGTTSTTTNAATFFAGQFALLDTGDARVPFVASDTSGNVLARLSPSTVLFRAANRHSVLITVGSDGHASRAVFDSGETLAFSNYSATAVDVALFIPGRNPQVQHGVSLPPAKASTLRTMSVGPLLSTGILGVVQSTAAIASVCLGIATASLAVLTGATAATIGLAAAGLGAAVVSLGVKLTNGDQTTVGLASSWVDTLTGLWACGTLDLLGCAIAGVGGWADALGSIQGPTDQQIAAAMIAGVYVGGFTMQGRMSSASCSWDESWTGDAPTRGATITLSGSNSSAVFTAIVTATNLSTKSCAVSSPVSEAFPLHTLLVAEQRVTATDSSVPGWTSQMTGTLAGDTISGTVKLTTTGAFSGTVSGTFTAVRR